MLSHLKTFCRVEDGAITLDWVGLTAAAIGLGIAVLSSVTANTSTATPAMSSGVYTASADTTFP